MYEITLPEKFNSIINKNQRLSGSIKLLLSKFSEWLYENRLVFFPEYTDHGIAHVQSVFNTAEKLITPDAFKLITPEDIYVLASSILLHDCAMHIDKAGIIELLNNDLYSSSLFGYRIEKSFADEWSAFESEVSKYTEKDWHSFFSDDSIVPFPNLQKELSERQFVIVGEFLRKHHARIAQVIGLHGLPTANGPINFFDNQLINLNELAGFAARSHNISLRQAIDLLGADNARFPKNTHLAFIMGVLRISDYIQFENKRTPKLCFQIRAFCSPISIIEWKKQLAILNTHHYHNDNELLFIDASPEDAVTLNGIIKLTQGLQNELDGFWAAMGELYSRYGEKSSLGITLRRIRSSIDDPIGYVERHYKDFHPILLGFKTNDERLYPLLTKPLYGDEPLVGLRELIQNSVDACNERFTHETGENPIRSKIPYNINIKIDIPAAELIIEDHGTGMDIEIISEYFLKIGSSYRYSKSWQDKFQKGESSLVPRTGRFGIGVLAGFLLGDKIQVHTRRYDQEESRALTFEITPSSQNIQLQYRPKPQIGTTIKISLNEKAIEKIKEYTKHEIHKRYFNRYSLPPKSQEWRWYYLDTPQVEFIILSDEKTKETLPNNYLIKKESIEGDWNLVSVGSPVSSFWRSAGHSHVFCNGVVIPTISSPRITLEGAILDHQSKSYEILYIDNDAALPLNLQRTGFLGDELHVIKEISLDMIKKHISTSISELKEYFERNRKLDKKAIRSSRHFSLGDSSYLFKNNTATPLFKGFDLSRGGYSIVDFTKHTLQRGLFYKSSQVISEESYGYLSVFDMDKHGDSVRGAINLLNIARLGTHYIRANSLAPADGKKCTGWIFVNKYDFAKLTDNEIKEVTENLTIKHVGSDWVSVTNTYQEQIPDDILYLLESGEDLNCFMFGLLTLPDLTGSESLFYKVWKDLQLPDMLTPDNILDIRI
ncbi:HD domain-containing protein [Pseudomonas glycinae]|uniref:HD domain-containing protein n=1 Tax=Pseudomonas glycinae TaxID=1785145 RepID=UPI001F415187|nr:ATP-binding protein [Pseudomonas glycinae]